MNPLESPPPQPPQQPPDWGDEQLIAYLDGVLAPTQRLDLERALASDAGLTARLAALTIETAALAQAFEPLLSRVPAVDLAAPSTPLHTTEQGSAASQRVRSKGSRDPTTWALAAGVVAAVTLSFVAGRWLEAPGLRPDVSMASSPKLESDWRRAVVDYQRLYVRETLSTNAPPDAAAIASQLANVSAHGGLVIEARSAALPGLAFRRAQTLGIDGRPLTQMAYVSETGEPVALCFTQSKAPASAPVPAVIGGMNTVSWHDGAFGFVLVGHLETAVLLKAARAAEQQFKRAG